MSYHRYPPCTPSASCAPLRCHPAPPPCQNPAKCFKKTLKKNIPPCQSAVAILADETRRPCSRCSQYTANLSDKQTYKYIKKYLKQKHKENKMKRHDRLKGTNRYERYMRKKGTKRWKRDCCAGHGHRGRLKHGKRKAGKGEPPPGRSRRQGDKGGIGRGCIIL